MSPFQIRKPAELPLEPVIYANNAQHIKATNSPSCEQIEPQKEELWNAESLLEEKAVQPASPEPVFPHQSSPPAVAHPTTSREVFPKENVSNVPLLPQKSTTANDLAFNLPKQQGLLWLSSLLGQYLKLTVLLSSANLTVGIGLSLLNLFGSLLQMFTEIEAKRGYT